VHGAAANAFPVLNVIAFRIYESGKEAALEAVMGPASNAIKTGQTVSIMVEGSESGEPASVRLHPSSTSKLVTRPKL
jgi:hypothetical protein